MRGPIALLVVAFVVVCAADDDKVVDHSDLFAEFFPKGEGLDPPADLVVEENLEVAGRIFRGCDGAADLCVRWGGSEGNKHLYMLYNTKKTWYHAKRSCEGVAAHLVTITSPEEMTFLTQSFGFDTDGQWGDWLGPWIGYSDAGDKGKWHWVTGEIAVTGQDTVYHNWYPNEPDNCCGGEDCAHVSGGHWRDRWNDAKCHYQLPYICEREF
eukprot:c45343_g1_i1.p1 GENE.c45343_g1_i1~~c45343_g1_i1.p1  ORF type:complete len:211 (+),score=38.76 c45343_g1_i1:23-655(+)